ncbi:MAG: hypothetical protein ACJ71N_12880 [Terriglobales bacterium]
MNKILPFELSSGSGQLSRANPFEVVPQKSEWDEKSKEQQRERMLSYRMDIYAIQNAPRGAVPKSAPKANNMRGLLAGAFPCVMTRAAKKIDTNPAKT